MTDLTFGATLMAFFATLIVAVIIETSPVPPKPAVISAKAHAAAVHLAKATGEESSVGVLAPTAQR